MDKKYQIILFILAIVVIIIISMYKPIRSNTITHTGNTYSITHYQLTKHIRVSLESLKNPGQPGACAVLVESREGFTKLPVECE